jgi:uncharacterized protein YggE
MNIRGLLFIVCAATAVASCSSGKPDPRGIDHDETMLSVSAIGRSENRPDQAAFTAGIETIRGDAKAASDANAQAMQKLVDALLATGVKKDDVQTSNISINRIDWGPNKNKVQAANTVTVKVRNVEKVSEAIAATTGANANLLSGPNLSISDPEKARLSAYGAAYKAAKVRAEAYAAAADMKIARVLTIRDGGIVGQPMPYEMDAMAEAAAPPPIVRTVAPPPVQVGTTTSEVSVQVDFALERK